MVRGVDTRREPGRVPLDSHDSTQLRRLGDELGRLGAMLPGSITARYTRCGRSGCRCMADPPRPHGPYWWWTRKVDAKTVTQILTEEQYGEYRAWFDNARRAKELIAEVEALSLAHVEADPRSTRRRKAPVPSVAQPLPPPPRRKPRSQTR